MAKPQTEKGYTRIANELLDALAQIRVPGEARQVLDVVFRQTYGWNRKDACISLSQFAVATGLKRPNVIRALRVLFGMNLIIRSDTTPASKFRINKDFDTWRPLSKAIPGIRSDTTPLSEVIPGGVSEAIPPTPRKPSASKGQREPKERFKEILKEISLRERLVKETKKIFPALSSIPDSIPDEKLDFFVYKVDKGEIRADTIKNPLAYLKALAIGEAFPSLQEREAKVEKKKQEERDRIKREAEEEKKALESRDFHKQKAREVISKLSGGKTCQTFTPSVMSFRVN
jgi:phage replication O-like protein O